MFQLHCLKSCFHYTVSCKKNATFYSLLYYKKCARYDNDIVFCLTTAYMLLYAIMLNYTVSWVLLYAVVFS